MKKLNLKNVVAVGRYNDIRSFCSASDQDLKPVKLTEFGQTGIYNSDLFSRIYRVKVLNFAGIGPNGRIWFKGWCAVSVA